MVFFILECIGFNIICMHVGIFRGKSYVEYNIQYSWLICQQSVI